MNESFGSGPAHRNEAVRGPVVVARVVIGENTAGHAKVGDLAHIAGAEEDVAGGQVAVHKVVAGEVAHAMRRSRRRSGAWSVKANGLAVGCLAREVGAEFAVLCRS